ncbi:hypothetical protein [Pantoea septica]|uniref:hypothetical protein n=1 Tax=Pantoea septica TaxID=472695 RepID=UPI00289994C3|nr:hypothetical protein [Pantoea septica]
MSDTKDYNGKSYLGKIPVTLLLDDFETASTLVQLARQYKIPVLEEDVIKNVIKPINAIERVAEIAKSLSKQHKKSKPNEMERLNELFISMSKTEK